MPPGATEDMRLLPPVRGAQSLPSHRPSLVHTALHDARGLLKAKARRSRFSMRRWLTTGAALQRQRRRDEGLSTFATGSPKMLQSGGVELATSHPYSKHRAPAQASSIRPSPGRGIQSRRVRALGARTRPRADGVCLHGDDWVYLRAIRCGLALSVPYAPRAVRERCTTPRSAGGRGAARSLRAHHAVAEPYDPARGVSCSR